MAGISKTIVGLVLIALALVAATVLVSASASSGEREPRADDAELRERLTPMQYEVTQRDATEPPFRNEYWDNKEPGIYVDVVSGEPLFSSTQKFKSGTGWPSFWAPLEEENVVEVKDRSLGMVRTEVRSKQGDSHLGHVFADGPEPTGLRYCINSAALRFIPADRLEEEGYGEYAHLFENGGDSMEGESMDGDSMEGDGMDDGSMDDSMGEG